MYCTRVDWRARARKTHQPEEQNKDMSFPGFIDIDETIVIAFVLLSSKMYAVVARRPEDVDHRR